MAVSLTRITVDEEQIGVITRAQPALAAAEAAYLRRDGRSRRQCLRGADSASDEPRDRRVQDAVWFPGRDPTVGAGDDPRAGPVHPRNMTPRRFGRQAETLGEGQCIPP